MGEEPECEDCYDTEKVAGPLIFRDKHKRLLCDYCDDIRTQEEE